MNTRQESLLTLILCLQRKTEYYISNEVHIQTLDNKTSQKNLYIGLLGLLNTSYNLRLISCYLINHYSIPIKMNVYHNRNWFIKDTEIISMNKEHIQFNNKMFHDEVVKIVGKEISRRNRLQP